MSELENILNLIQSNNINITFFATENTKAGNTNKAIKMIADKLKPLGYTVSSNKNLTGHGGIITVSARRKS